ncbi:MAG: MBL fold metallo-hydrolase [Candidatus Falkowbacteria bacterium]
MKLQRRHKIIIIIGTLLFLSATAALISYYHYEEPNLKMFFLNVGQGDAILIETPNGKTILIDGGPDNSVLPKLAHYLPWFSHQIDFVILTHPHADHLTGLVEVLKRYDVGQVIGTNLEYRDGAYTTFLNIITAKKIPINMVHYGQSLNFSPDCFFKILHPLNSDQFNKYTNLNNTSVVGQLNCEQRKILFTGDIENNEAKKIYDAGIDLKSDILKVSHHGSQQSNDLNFLSQIKSKIAIISVGAKNKYGHPNNATLNNLQKLAMKILRTDQCGDITIIIKNGLILTKN